MAITRTRTKILKYFCSFKATLFFLLLIGTAASSNPNTITVQSVGEQQVAMPDIENWTFGSMPSIEGMEPPSQILPLGSLSSLGASEFTLVQTAAFSGVDVEQLSIQQIPLVGEQTLGSLVLGDGVSAGGVPFLADFTLQQVPPLAQSLQQNPQFSNIDLSQNLGQFVADNSLASNMTLNELGNLKVGDIPNLGNTPIKDFPDWENVDLESIPGLSDIPLSQFPNPLSLGSVSIVARIDTVRGTAEGSWERTVTGSSEVGFEFPCNKNNENTESCSHIELDDPENLGVTVSSPFEGKAWINGQEQWVDGGSGLLKMVVMSPIAKPGLEPTGRFPFGEFAKMVLWEVDETNDSAQFVLFLRYCNAGGCTPYNIGPIPFMEYKRNAMIPIGSSQVPSNNKLALKVEQKLALSKNLPQKGFSQLSEGVTGKEVTGGISPEIMADGILSILSGGAHLISVASPWELPVTCIQGNCGKSLGRYGLHSTHPLVIDAITHKQGGDNFLRNLTKPQYPTKSEINIFFPHKEQSQIIYTLISRASFQAANEVDPTTNNYFCGDRLVERTAQILAGGKSTPIDSEALNADGSLNIYSFGTKVLAYYRARSNVIECPH